MSWQTEEKLIDNQSRVYCNVIGVEYNQLLAKFNNQVGAFYNDGTITIAVVREIEKL